MSHTEIPTIRRRRETVEFRKWPWSQPDPADAENVSEAYLAAMAPKADVRDTQWFKAARIAFVGVVGSVAGLAATAAAGPEAGLVGGTIASTVAGIGTSLVDGFWIDALLTKPNPRRLATDVLTPIVTARTQALSALPRLAEGATSHAERRPPAPGTSAGYTASDVASNTPSDNQTRHSQNSERRDRNRRKSKRKAQRDARRKTR